MFDYFYNTPGLKYSEGFAYRFALTSLVHALIGLGCFFILYIASVLLKRRIKNKHPSAIDNSEKDSSYLSFNSSLDQILQKLNGEEQTGKDRAIIILTKILLILSCLAAL